MTSIVNNKSGGDTRARYRNDAETKTVTKERGKGWRHV